MLDIGYEIAARIRNLHLASFRRHVLALHWRRPSCSAAMRWLCILITGCGLSFAAAGQTKPTLQLSGAEQAWLAAQQGKTLTVGFDPYAGLDSFELQGRRVGLLPELLKDIQTQLGIQIVPADVKNWDDAYQRFISGDINILYGANPTPERELIMRFTQPVWKHPYTVFARKNDPVQSLGDLDEKPVGFLRNDFVIQQLPKEYPRVRPKSVEFDEPGHALLALGLGQVDGFVTSGGGVEFEYLYAHPELTLIAELHVITSDMTMAVSKDQAVFAGILDKYIAYRKETIRDLMRDAVRLYNRKIFRLTEAELNWLDQKGEAVVGVAADYLPFDYFHQGEYRGIAGEMLKRVADSLGIRLKVVSGSFAEIMQQASAGKIDIVNMAKTEDRLKSFIFPHPISAERDIIVGLKTSAPVQDIYQLEGLPVAVIEGFWHEEFLNQNLKNPVLIKTSDIKESLQLLRSGKVAYIVENPTVVEFYINGLGYSNVVKRGNTSKDSFVYFGVGRHEPELASIMDKVIPLIRFEEVKFTAIQGVPSLQNEANMQLLKLVAVMGAALFFIVLITVLVVRRLVEQKARTQLLIEREHFLYTDTLTGFHNRNAFSNKVETAEVGCYPRAVVVADLNNLKQVNDEYGHAAGDALLVMFAEQVRIQWPQSECYRIGGDEFLILLSNTTETELIRALEAFRVRCQDVHCQLPDGSRMQTSAAMGHAFQENAEASLDKTIALADAQMYQVKASMKRRRSDEQDLINHTSQ